MGSLIFPPYLQEGDRVIVLSPSSKIDKSFLKGAYKRLKSWGLEGERTMTRSPSCRYGGKIRLPILYYQSILGKSTQFTTDITD